MLNDEWGPEETQVLRGDADNILLHSAADAIERRDAEIRRRDVAVAALSEEVAIRDADIIRLIEERSVAIHAKVSAEGDTKCLQNLLDEARAESERLKKQLSGERCPECDGELVFVGYVGTNVDHMGEQYDCALCSLRYDLKLAKDSAEKAEALIENLRIQRDRLCVIINDNTPDGAQPCTVDMLEGAVKWLCWELHRLLALAREFKAELYGGQKP